MKTLTYTHRHEEREQWGKGPWLGEPDKKQWTDRRTKLPCLAVRGPVGAWCGYVGVAEGHPAFGKGYDDVQCGVYDENYDKKLVEPIAPEIQVHGGLTFASFCVEDEKEHGICHLVEPGENDRVWWLGFDCAHGQDYCPGIEATLIAAGHYEKYPQYDPRNKNADPFSAKHYRTLRYVEEECKNLARALAKVA